MGENGRPRMYPPMYVGLSVLLMLGLHHFLPGRQIIDWPSRYWGLVPVVLGLWVVLSVRIMFIRAGTTIKPFQESSKLVVNGPFRFSRNPIYLGMTVALFGFAMVLGSLTPFLVPPMFFLVINRYFVPVEEAMLAAAFGSQFDEYRGRVRRWL